MTFLSLSIQIPYKTVKCCLELAQLSIWGILGILGHFFMCILRSFISCFSRLGISSISPVRRVLVLYKKIKLLWKDRKETVIFYNNKKKVEDFVSVLCKGSHLHSSSSLAECVTSILARVWGGKMGGFLSYHFIEFY